MVATSFGARLKVLRESAGYSRELFAEKVLITVEQLDRIEAQVIEPDWPTVLRASRLLQVLPNDFILDGDFTRSFGYRIPDETSLSA